ncbi:MAG: Trm112 family protein [Caldimicrobium sp.]|nr:Trm112 family protein [Caldimicrobium sp.]MCX7613179.1 Trm112 family protein [Caldimicrobium sp.]MDW8182519.1 Trm112 family protein [Caldimicrobium sp.]
MEEDRIRTYLEVLACPKCKGDLSFYEEREKNLQGFLCKRCALIYPIVEDIPNMIPEEAISLQDESS